MNDSMHSVISKYIYFQYTKKIMFKDIEIDKDKPNLTEDKRFDQDHYVS